MRKLVVIIAVVLLAAAGAVVYNRTSDAPASGGAANGGYQPGGRGGPTSGARPPMPVEFADVKRAAVAEQILVVGNLIGEATVQVVPRVNGRLQSVDVKL